MSGMDSPIRSFFYSLAQLAGNMSTRGRAYGVSTTAVQFIARTANGNNGLCPIKNLLMLKHGHYVFNS